MRLVSTLFGCAEFLRLEYPHLAELAKGNYNGLALNAPSVCRKGALSLSS